MRKWKNLLVTIGILLEIISIRGFVYMTTIIPALDLKAALFYSAPVAGMLYGVFMFVIAVRIRAKKVGE